MSNLFNWDSGKPAAVGDMQKSTYDPDNDGNVEKANQTQSTHTLPLISKLAGRKSWCIHHPDADTLILAPSASVDGEDWDWTKQIVLNSDGSITILGQTLSKSIMNALTFGLRANHNLTGGGVLKFTDSGYFSWTRFIVISNGRGADLAASGYFDINLPAEGTTITGVGGAANRTVTADGVLLNGWDALYYILPLGSGATSQAANFRIVNYTLNVEIPPEWVLIALRNNSDDLLYVGTGARLKPRTEYSGSRVPSAFPYCKVGRTANKSIANNVSTTWTAIDWNTLYGGTATAAMHDNATNNTRIYAPIAGQYLVACGLKFGPQSTGVGHRALWIKRNAAGSVANGYGHAYDLVKPLADANWDIPLLAVGSVWMNENDYMEAFVFQNSGGALDAKFNSEDCYFYLGFLH